MKHVEKSFHGISVIKDISLSVGEGEIVSIIGPSGSGKSTLLRCATMLETMDRGELIYMGERAAWNDETGKMTYVPKKDLKRIQENYGLVFQNFNLFPHFSVIKNIIDAPISVQKRDKNEVYRTGKELLKKMGLERLDAFTSFNLKYLLSAYPANMATIMDSTQATTDTNRLFLI